MNSGENMQKGAATNTSTVASRYHLLTEKLRIVGLLKNAIHESLAQKIDSHAKHEDTTQYFITFGIHDLVIFCMRPT